MNVTAYLRKLDQEITQHRQQIALHQLEIAKIEDARRVIVGIEEREAGHFGSDHGLGEPVLVARRAEPEPAKLLAASEAGELSKAAKSGAPAPNATWPIKILAHLAVHPQPQSAGDIVVALGAELTPTKRRIYGALAVMKQRGELRQDAAGLYSATGKKSKRYRATTPQGALSGPKAKGQRGELRRSIEKLVSDMGPLTGTQIVKTLVPVRGSKKEMDRVYGALFGIRRAADDPIEYDGTVYRLKAA